LQNIKKKPTVISIHETKCQVCGFDFLEAYGEYGRGFIEIHHKIPLGTRREEIAVDPGKDLTCLCSNCHRMIHRRRDDILAVEELKALYRENERYGGLGRLPYTLFDESDLKVQFHGIIPVQIFLRECKTVTRRGGLVQLCMSQKRIFLEIVPVVEMMAQYLPVLPDDDVPPLIPLNMSRS
jgi:hypothetical protein